MSSPQTTPSARHARTRTTSRRVGYAVAVAVDAVMLLLVNRSPGWEAVPFLTGRTAEVIPIVNASLVVGIVVNVLYLVGDPVWLRAAGDVVTTGVGLAALVRIWQVWPVDLTSGWEVLARVLVGLGVVGSMIGILTALVRLTRWFAGSPSSPGDSHPANATTRQPARPPARAPVRVARPGVQLEQGILVQLIHRRCGGGRAPEAGQPRGARACTVEMVSASSAGLSSR